MAKKPAPKKPRPERPGTKVRAAARAKAGKDAAVVTRQPELTIEDLRRACGFYQQHGLKGKACEMAGFTLDALNIQLKRRPDWEQEWEAAARTYRESLVKEAHRRAVEGVQEPIIGGKDRDQVVTHVTRYSDGLLSQMLKAQVPEFSPKLEVQHHTNMPKVDLTQLSQGARNRVRELLEEVKAVISEDLKVIDVEHEAVS